MDRNYPHNEGLLSDAEDSALAAAVLNHTQGMSYESWKGLNLEQRLPWMVQAVKKLVTTRQPDQETTSRTAPATGDFQLPENVTHKVEFKSEFLPTPSGNDPKGLREAAAYCRAQATQRGDATAKWWWTQASLYDQGADEAEKKLESPSVAPTVPEKKGRKLVVDETTFSVTWDGRESLKLGNTRQFRLLQELANSADQYVTFAELAERLGGDAMDSITPTKSRLVAALKQGGYEDLATRIKTQTGHYGLFIS